MPKLYWNQGFSSSLSCWGYGQHLLDAPQWLKQQHGMLRFLSFWGQIQASEHTSVTSGRQDGSSFNLRWAGAKLFQVYCENAVLWALRPVGLLLLWQLLQSRPAKQKSISCLLSIFSPFFACFSDWWRHGGVSVAMISSTWLFSLFSFSFLHSATRHPITETVNVRNQRPEKFSQINQKLKLFSIYIASPICVYIYSSQDLRGNVSVGDTTLRLH